MYDGEVEMNNCEKLLEDQRQLSCFLVKYGILQNQIFIWLDNYKKNSSVRYLVKKCVEDERMTKLYELWSLINRGVPLLLAIPQNKRSQVEGGKVDIVQQCLGRVAK